MINVVIPHWNGRARLDNCLRSLDIQTFRDFDITIVDNGSTDDSLAVCRERRSSVRILKLDRNMGFGTAVNHGIRNSSGPLILVLNNDTELDKSCLAEINAAAQAHSSWGFFAPCLRETSRPQEIYAAGLMHSDRGYGNRSDRASFITVKQPTEVFGACGAAAVFRRDVLNDVGLFNEAFFLMYEDQELSYRHQLKGYRCLFLPDAIVYHVGSATLRDHFRIAVAENVKNSLITLLTCTPSPLLRRNGLRIVSFYLKLCFHLVRLGYARELLSGLTNVIRNSTYLVSNRRAIQSATTVDLAHLETLFYRGPITLNFPSGSLVL